MLLCQTKERKESNWKGKQVKKLPLNEINLLTNQYRTRNEEKIAEETAKEKAEATKRLLRKPVDPLLGLPPGDEPRLKAEAVDRTIAKERVARKLARLPLSYKKREPINLNPEENSGIVSDAVLYCSLEESRRKQYGVRYDFENKVKIRDQTEQDQADSKCLRRYFARRFVEEYADGNNPISLQPASKELNHLQFARGCDSRHYLPFAPPPRNFRQNKYGIAFN